MSGLKVTRIATAGQELAGGYALDASYAGTDVDATTGLPLDGLLDVNAPAPDDGDVLVWDDGAGEWIAAPGGGSITVADEGTPLATSATTLDFVGTGVVASGTGATKTITISSSSPFLNVTDYGAVGDDTNDDTSALQDAYDAAPNGATIWHPPGTYKITSLITITGKNLLLLGAGDEYGPSVIKQHTANTGALYFNYTSYSGSRKEVSLIRSLLVQGPATGASPASSGIGINSASDVNLEHVGVSGFYIGLKWAGFTFYSKAYGCLFTNCTYAAVQMDGSNNCTLDTCRITGAFGGAVAPIGPIYFGVLIAGGTYGNAHRIVNTSIEYYQGFGIYANGCEALTVSGCYSETQQSTASDNSHVFLEQCTASVISGHYLEAGGSPHPNAWAVDIKGGSATIANCTVKAGATGTIRTRDSAAVVLLNNDIAAGTLTLAAGTLRVDADAAVAPESVGLANSAGTSPYVALADHVHAGPAEIEDIVDLPTAETDTALVLQPDGAGGVLWAAAAATGVGELVVADGTTGPSGITPTSYVEMTTPDSTTSASLEDITGATTTITLQRTSHVAAWMTCHVSAGAVCTLGLAINFDGTDHDVVDVHLDATDEGSVTVLHRTATELAPGTYTVKGRMQRVSGGGTPSVDRVDLMVMAMGHSGPVLVTTDDETDYVYADLA